MTFVITQRCCSDASCIAECPVDCIRPRPEDPEYKSAEMLYIDPDTCIDCGACADACPVDAIYSEFDVPEEMGRYVDLNRVYFERYPLDTSLDGLAPSPKRLSDELGTLRVAIIGAGPAACYAAEELLARGKVEVEIFDRLAAPWGLIRSGVAPDHQETKGVANMFATAFRSDAVNFHLNVNVGEHVSLAELLDHHHAVIYAVGASSDRHLGIPGEDLPGSHSATEFVAWYNGHPDHAGREFDLSGERAVIVGNGNVALDVARILTLDPDELAGTDIADHALEALRESNIREVVVLGRRGPVQGAYSASEFLALAYLPGVDVVIDPEDLVLDDASSAVLDDPEVDPTLTFKMDLAREFADRPAAGGNRRIVFRYLASPTELRGGDRVEALEYVRNELDAELNATPTDETGSIATSLVLRSVGYRGAPVTDVPFDDARGVIPNERGRVADLTGVYTTGWIKRGPRGVIGTNRADSAETIATLIEDFEAGTLTPPTGSRTDLAALLAERQPEVIDKARWSAIDAAEKAAGTPHGRPRVKFISLEQLRATID
ncbi:FAD-dependent oxidoreductase [Aldersonia kunmingensis]|uniref:FAD-dependent oxidoreductase n=1 Tax=Aldersonia kunmingensis TaxID=408066 RepID=UPI00082A0440|nr:FAD-dependent oxidoreductase [Aldersonia kunmingensis]